MREPADRDQVDAGRRDRRRRRGGDAARGFGDRPAVGHGDRLPEVVDAHVVEQDRVDAERQRLLELGQRIDLDLDLDQVTGMRPWRARSRCGCRRRARYGCP